jgi:outer membrane receptor protein involved in Fe transport
MLRPIALSLLFSSAVATSAQVAPQPTKPTVQQSVTVTADRGLSGINDSASSVAVLDADQLQSPPALALDDRLHSVAGFQLFRRTSSWTANPTSQGLSLRGLGSTAASRTLVVSDQVPLTDPFGGWVHWNEVPALAIQQVELLRGGAADLYGSSAIGGVVNIVPRTPRGLHELHLAADASGATENSALTDLFVSTSTHRIAALIAGSGLTTGGYIPTATAIRGTVDVPSNVTSESGRIELRTPSTLAQSFTAFLRGNVLNESRSNGTPDQTNATRLWRYAVGADTTHAKSSLLLRLYGEREGYRQSFSSIAANRNSESLTRLQRSPLDALGFVSQATHAFAHNFTAALGLDLHDLRADDHETPVSNNAPSLTTNIASHQRAIGGYGDAVWQPHGWSISGSIRVDSFRTFNAQSTVTNSATISQLPTIAELFAGPRLGIVRILSHGLALTATAFRAFRGPTMNELYRTGQVGSQITLPNNALLAERATGFEFGPELEIRTVRLRATYFWTEVNRPISAVLLSQTATTQTLQRQNLGQIRSRGLMLEAQSKTFRGFDATFGYQLAIATVTSFSAQPTLVSNWIPEVPRQSVTATFNYDAHTAHSNIADLHLIASYQGQEFDDAANQYLLHPYARFDLSADRKLRHGLSLFAGAQNLLDRSIDAGRTPTLTLAAPRLVQAGMRYTFNR